MKIKESLYEWINNLSSMQKQWAWLPKMNFSLHERVSYIYALKLHPWHTCNYLFLKKGFLTNKLLTVSIVSDAERPIMRNKYIDWFLNLHELVHIVLAHMIYWSNVTLVIRNPLVMTCSNKTHREHNDIFLDVQTIVEPQIIAITKGISSTIKACN